MHRLEYTEDGSNKFWMAEVNTNTLVVHFGRIGTQGQVQVKSFATHQAACAERDQKLAEKRRKGYREVAFSAQDHAKLAGVQAPGAGAPSQVAVKQPGFWARLFGARPQLVHAPASELRCEYCDWRLAASAVRCENCGAKAPRAPRAAA